jgi:hypothetical protein
MLGRKPRSPQRVNLNKVPPSGATLAALYFQEPQMTDEEVKPKLTDEERRAKDAERKRNDRARKKQEDAAKATETILAQARTLEEFWAASLTTADSQKLAEWRVRQEQIFDTLYWMRQVMDGTYNVSPDDTECYVGIEEGDEDIKRMLREYGETFATAVVLLPFWQEPQTLAQLTQGGENQPTTIFAKFGILTALPDFKVHQWGQFMQAHRRKGQPRVETPQVLYVSLHCSLCKAPPTSVSSEIAAAYARSREYLCANCSKKAAKLRNFTQEQRGPEHAIFDNWGRVKT